MASGCADLAAYGQPWSFGPFRLGDPPSRFGYNLFSKGAAKTQIGLGHEKLPDADAADRIKLHVA